MTSLSDFRRAIRPLLNERDPADALESYYAFYHSDNRTTLIPYPPQAELATGYVALSRTGIDLFRPLVTMRLPRLSPTELDLTASVQMLYSALPAQTPLIFHIPTMYMPLIRAISQVDREQHLRLFRLDEKRFQPMINIFVVQSASPDGLPRFVIRQSATEANSENLAIAGINWQSNLFADIFVHTHASYRRQGYGQSVVATLAHHLLQKGRTPLYVVDPENDASVELAQTVGFVDTLSRSIIVEGSLIARSDL